MLNIGNEECKLMKMISKRQMNWIGHITCRDSLVKTILEVRIQGKKVLGRLRIMILDWLKDKEK